MATANVRLYQATELYNDRNYIIDDIESFLNEKTFETVELVTYFKHQLHATLKLQVPQSHLNYFDTSFKYTYLSIQNVDGLTAVDSYPVYYYITNKTWRSTETIEYTLEMDVLNTFTEERGNFTFSNKTLVIREMRDRFSNISGHVYKRIVDEVDEGMTPSLYREGDNPLNDLLEDDRRDWYLVYMNDKNASEGAQEGVLPIKIALYTNDSSFYMYQISKPTITGNTFVYLIDPIFDLIFYSDSQPTEKWTTGNKEGFKHFDVIAISAGNAHGYNYQPGSVDLMEEGVTFLYNDYRIGICADTENAYYYTHSGETRRKSDFLDNQEEFISNTSSIPSIDLLDRTNTYLSKIIKLPYCPIKFGKTESGIAWMPSEWDLEYIDSEHQLYGEALFTKQFIEFENTITFTNFSPFSPLRIRIDNFGVPQTPKDPLNESKLYHSAFYVPKVSMDTFSKAFELERMNDTDVSVHTSVNLDVIFKPTNTMNSKMAFIFPQYKCTNKSPEDFYNLLVVARNNEETIFNSAYLDYMRVGYGYDEQSRVLGLVNSGFSNFTNILNSGSAGEALMKFGVGTWQVYSQFLQGDISKERALANMRAQGVSVSGAESPDILKKIAGNRLIHSIYKLKDIDKNYIYNLFFYNGYLTNMVKAPNHNTRMYFDYLQCALDTSVLYNIPEECKTALKEKFSNGVTYFHKDSNGNYDINQIYENWEKNL